MQEALNMAIQGYKVHYLALGDLKMKDFIIRLGAQFSGCSFSEVSQNIGPIYNSMCQIIGNNGCLTRHHHGRHDQHKQNIFSFEIQEREGKCRKRTRYNLTQCNAARNQK